MSILIVEDQDELRDMLVRLCKGMGLVVVDAENGAVARRLLQEGLRPKLICSDFLMPRLNGLDLLRYVRDEVSEALPFILFSGNALDIKSMAKHMGASYVIEKSDMHELLRTLKELKEAA